MSKFHTVKSVSPLDDLCLDVFFQTGERKKYDVRPLLKIWPVFEALRDMPGLFEQVHTDMGGYGVSWNDDIDLSCDELWENGKAYVQH